jgi:hypothetical protein
MKITIEDRDAIAIDVYRRPDTDWFDRIMIALFGLSTSNLYTATYKFWLEDNSYIRPGDAIYTENGLRWTVALVGTNNTIVAMTSSPHPLRVYDEMDYEGTLFINNERLEATGS